MGKHPITHPVTPVAVPGSTGKQARREELVTAQAAWWTPALKPG